MVYNKANRISQIKDEVNELHPLLNRLLKLLPGIRSVEYTHGPNEMGADFVMDKLHEQLSQPMYVAVIAKTGKILQDYTSIERQIKECDVPRYVMNGKRNVSIDEIWVITTDTISENAKRKINNDYGVRNVRFIDGGTLADLVDQHAPDYWLEINVDVGEYLSKTRVKYFELDRKVDMVAVGDDPFFIELDVIKVANNTYTRMEGQRKDRFKDEKVDIVAEIKRQRFILLEGAAGSGKSKLLRQLMIQFSNPEEYVISHIIPAYTTFKDLVDGFEGDVKVATDSILGKAAQHLKEGDTVLLLIDGMDEKNISASQQIDAIRSIEEQVATLKNLKVVIASRFMRGVRKENGAFPVRISYQLAPLSMRKIAVYIEKICSKLNIKTRILDDINRSVLFKQISRTPVAAILLAQLLNENSHDIPSNLTELYTKYLELVLGRWDIDRGLQSQKEYDTLSVLLMDVASYMLDNDILSISIHEVRGMLGDYLRKRNLDIDGDQLFQKMVDRYDIVLLDEKTNTMSFKHKTFMEYYFARKSFVRRVGLPIDQRVFNLYWMNTYFFYLGLIKDAPELLDEIMDLNPQDDFEKWIKIINMPNYLLAAYSTPYDTIKKGIFDSIVETARLYIDITTGKIDTPLATLPRMHLLYVIQLIIKRAYNYEFLQNALTDVALDILTSNLSEDEKAYAVFFLVVCQVEGGNESFDFLLREMKDVPMDISLAMKHESEDFSSRSDLLNKHRKRIDKMMAKDKSLKDLVKKWYETPVNLLPPPKSK